MRAGFEFDRKGVEAARGGLLFGIGPKLAGGNQRFVTGEDAAHRRPSPSPRTCVVGME
jgi:hypothetical protein